MITIPLTTVLEKLKESGLTDEEIDVKLKQKMDQLSGLISREGAAHILANELGIKIVNKVSGRVKIKEVLAGMRNVETVGKVIAVFDPVSFERNGAQSKVHNFVIADDTGTIKVVCWGKQADVSNAVVKDMVVKVIGTYSKENQGRKELHLNDFSKLILNPADEAIGEIAAAQRTYTRMKITDLQENSSGEILATIVAADALRFFEVCPNCNSRARRVRVEPDEYRCDTHGIVPIPDYSYVMNLVIDDGTNNIRAVLFREMVEKALGVEKSVLVGMRDSQDLQTLKTKLIGTIIKVRGRVKKNQMFERLELAVQELDMTPDPYEEMVALDEDIEKARKASSIGTIDDM